MLAVLKIYVLKIRGIGGVGTRNCVTAPQFTFSREIPNLFCFMSNLALFYGMGQGLSLVYTASSMINIKLTLMVGSTRSMAAHCRGVRLLASSRMTCSWKYTAGKAQLLTRINFKRSFSDGFAALC